MSYPIGTTLTRKDPFEDEDRAPLNHLRVIAESPLKTASTGEWAGSPSGEHLVCTPVDVFGGNEPVPVSVLQEQYDVEHLPEEPEAEIESQRPRTRPVRPESPHEAFERMDRERAAAEAAKPAAKKAK